MQLKIINFRLSIEIFQKVSFSLEKYVKPVIIFFSKIKLYLLAPSSKLFEFYMVQFWCFLLIGSFVVYYNYQSITRALARVGSQLKMQLQIWRCVYIFIRSEVNSIRNLKGNEMDMMVSRSTSHCYLYANKST